ncbi:uncharacterized protein B0T23DRAFT_142573 [Neurospora hispaniola]|uniref:Uncharacterized protein n=1 Tax=Neurospora hispaniola TaxID=588809 RepID=A0AAJ0MRA7_9PEZI|nr:hypothetical protein B0T23DRAFT_142573 [Neurospora hispaniola]
MRILPSFDSIRIVGITSHLSKPQRPQTLFSKSTRFCKNFQLGITTPLYARCFNQVRDTKSLPHFLSQILPPNPRHKMSLCKACSEPLYLEVDPDYDLDQDSNASDDGMDQDHDNGGPSSSSSHPQQVPDDLLLPCNCHYHWQCLMDLSSSVALSLRCPSCNTYLPTNSSSSSSSGFSGSSNPVPVSATNPVLPTSQGLAILTQYHNEGGVQSSLDILPALTEEAYLSSNPSARPARAMHTMAAEGDFAGIIELLTDVAASEDEETTITPSELLTFRDPLNEGKTALHLAVENGREEVFWLLLWLGSGLPTEVFPAEVVEVANGVGVGERRAEVGAEEDVRWVRDERGRSVKEVCGEVGGRWAEMAVGGLFD